MTLFDFSLNISLITRLYSVNFIFRCIPYWYTCKQKIFFTLQKRCRYASNLFVQNIR